MYFLKNIAQTADRIRKTSIMKKMSPFWLSVTTNILSGFFLAFYHRIWVYVLSAAAILIAVAAIWQYHNVVEENKRKRVYSMVMGQAEMKKKGRGLVVYASRVFKKEEIDAATNAFYNLKTADETEKALAIGRLFALQGIGHVFRTILHHSEKLEHLWIFYSEGDAGSELCKDLAAGFAKKISAVMKVEAVPVKDPDSITEIGGLIQSKVKEVFPRLGLSAGEVVFNLTTGNAISSCAMVLQNNPIANPCVLEYITQSSKKLIEVSLVEK